MRPSRKAIPKDATGPEQVDAYIAAAPKAARTLLRHIRSAIRSAAPGAEEKLSYRMPYYSYHGRLIYFAAFANHVGVYLMGASRERFAEELEPFRTTPTTMRIPIGSKAPLALLRRIVKARVAENEAAHAARRTRRRGASGTRKTARARGGSGA